MNELSRRQAMVLAAGITLAGYAAAPEPVDGLERIMAAIQARYQHMKVKMQISTGHELRNGVVVQGSDPQFALHMIEPSGKRVSMCALLPVLRTKADVERVATELASAYDRYLARSKAKALEA